MSAPLDVKLYFPHKRALQHTMSYVLDKWAFGKVSLPALAESTRHGWPIRVHGVFSTDFAAMFPGMAPLAEVNMRDAPNSNLKVHNVLRPRFFWETCVDGTKCLHLAVAPGYDYLMQFAGIVRHVVSCLATGPPEMAVMYYPDLDAGLAENTGLRTKGLVHRGDVIVLGHVDEVQSRLDGDVRRKLVSAFSTEMYTSTRLDIGANVVNFIGCKATFWGNMAGTLCNCLCELGCREIIYIAKLGTLRGPSDIYTVLHSPTHYLHIRHADRNTVRVIMPDQCPNRLVELLEEKPWVESIRSGKHMSVGTVVEEDLEQISVLRSLNVDSIDNELFYMAEAVHRFNNRVELEDCVYFTPIHFATDYLRTPEEVTRATTFDLSNNRTVDACKGKAQILYKATELFTWFLQEGTTWKNRHRTRSQSAGSCFAGGASFSSMQLILQTAGATLIKKPSLGQVRADGYREDVEHLAATMGYRAGPEAPVYLDFAGAALISSQHSLLAEHLLRSLPPGNPHTSADVRDVLRCSERRVLEHFGVSDSEYKVIFTSNATAALRLVADNFPFGPASVFAYDLESHTSVLGLRGIAAAQGARVGWYDVDSLESMTVSCQNLKMLDGALQPSVGCGPNLLAITAESNFSGVRADLALISRLRGGPFAWWVLLDAAKYAALEPLSLETIPASFVAVSFYKMFGRPTGLGALLVRTDAQDFLHGMHERYFGGGSIAVASAKSSFAVPAGDVTTRLSYGTSNFLAIAELPIGLEQVLHLHGSQTAAAQHAKAVATEAAQRMCNLQHASGGVVCEVYGKWMAGMPSSMQGPTVAFNIRDVQGHVFPFLHVEARAKGYRIVLRAGSLCNVGGCQKYLGLTCDEIKAHHGHGFSCSQPIDVVNDRPTGAIRASFGPTSCVRDVDKLITFLKTFIDTKVVEDTCVFCKEIIWRENPHFMAELPGYTSHRIMFPGQPPQLGVCVAVGCMAAGYLLVIPRKHVISFGSLPTAELQETEAFIERVRSCVSESFGPAIVAEHGSSAEAKTCSASCIDHAHLHIIPLPNAMLADRVARKYEEIGGLGTRLERLHQLHDDDNCTYLLLSTRPGSWVLWTEHIERFPKQFVRRVVADVLGSPGHFDWRQEPHFDNMKDTLDHLSTTTCTTDVSH